MQCTPCWLLIRQDQSTGYAATFFPHTPQMIIPRERLFMRLRLFEKIKRGTYEREAFAFL